MGRKWIVILMLLFSVGSSAQSVEYYAGDKRTGVDIMWFKYFNNAKDARTPFLFFSRNRASTDYHGSPALFASTNAVSYNFRNGIGIVGVAAFLQSGILPKAGFQYFKQKGNLMFFGWLVADIKKEGNIDLFALLRYQPRIKGNWRAYSQLELFPVHSPSAGSWTLIERIRLGMKYQRWSGGFMTDLSQTGSSEFTTSSNFGAFVRYEFQ